jgi:hypothetical protein
MRRIDGQDAAAHKPVEDHANGSQVLLDGRLFEILAERLDISRHVQRFDLGQLSKLVVLTPGEEPANCVDIGNPSIPVPDRGGEELEEPPGSVVAGLRRYF